MHQRPIRSGVPRRWICSTLRATAVSVGVRPDAGGFICGDPRHRSMRGLMSATDSTTCRQTPLAAFAEVIRMPRGLPNSGQKGEGAGGSALLKPPARKSVMNKSSPAAVQPSSSRIVHCRRPLLATAASSLVLISVAAPDSGRSPWQIPRHLVPQVRRRQSSGREFSAPRQARIAWLPVTHSRSSFRSRIWRLKVANSSR